MKGLCPWNNGSNIINKVKDTIIEELLENPNKEVTSIVENILGEISKGDSYEIIRNSSTLVNLAQNLVSDLIEEGYLVEESVRQDWATQLATILQTVAPIIEETNEASDEKLLNGTYDEEDSNFMQEAYLGSAEAQQLATQQGKRHIVTSLIYRNRDGAKSIISSQLDLNESIREKQQELLEVICDYLKSTIKNNSAGIDRVAEQYNANVETIYNHILNPQIYREGKQSDFDYIKQRFGDIYFKRPENLNDLIDNFVSPIKDELKLKYLKAYNAYILLDNFDAFVKEQLGKVININEEVGRFAPNRYSISQEGTNVYTTWRTTDEIWLDKEINNIAQLIITTLPMWKAGSDVPQEGRYMTFNQFNYIIGKIKSGMFGMPGTGFDVVKAKLSESTQKYLQNVPSIQELLLKSRTNPQRVWKTVFEILASSDAATINTLFNIPQGASNKFTEEDTDIIYTLYREIFGNTQSSLASSINSKVATSAYNYLSNLSQVIDSVFRAKYIQYYTDENTGDIRIRALGDQTLGRIRKSLERKINNVFAKVDYNTFKETYPVVNIETNKDGSFHSATFKIVGQNKTLIVNYDGSKFRVQNEDGTNANLYELENATEIVKAALGINLDSPEYQNAFSNIVGRNVTDGKSILMLEPSYSNFTLKSILRTILNNELLRGENGKLLTRPEVDSRLDKLFGLNKPTINLAAAGMSTIDNNDIPKLKQLARIEAQRLGLSTSAQVKGGDNNSLSNFTLSRLGDSYPHQWHLQNRLKESSTKHFSILNSPAFAGLFQAKEFKDKDANHPSEDMSEAEMITASFIQDFLGQLGNSEDGEMMYIIPAVISDKKFIGRLAIKLYELFDPNVEGSPTWEEVLNSDNYKELLENKIRKEFYEYFSQSEAAINEDFDRINVLLDKHASENEYFYQILDSLMMDDTKYDPELGFRLSRRGVEEFTKIFEAAKARYNMSKSQDLPFINYSAADFLYKITRDYNLEHPYTPIVLIDQVHFINEKGTLISNPTLTNSIDRFSSKKSTGQFFEERNISTVSSLLEKGFKYRISEKENKGSGISVNNLIYKNIGQDWLDNRGMFILAKLTDKEGKVYNITSQASIEALSNIYGNSLRTLKGLLATGKFSNIEINPRIEQWNYMDYFWSEQFIISTVGHHYAHPNKALGQWLSGGALTPALLINDEAVRKEMQNKRNVSITATMHEFVLGDLMGIPSEYNIANIDDIKDLLYNITGNIDGGVKPYDGATFVNPFIVYLENYSLGGSKAGVVKKQFVHFYDHRTGTGGIIKTAGFGLTNMTIRDSVMDEAVMKSMADRPWRASQNIVLDGNIRYTTNQLINAEDANILIDFNGNAIDYGYFYYREGDNYYQERIESYDNFTYKGQRIQCDINGTPLQNATWEDTEYIGVNSNYKVWKMFGGKNSMELNGGKLVPSEESIKLTIHAINNVGISLTPEEKTTQDDVYQFMKHSDVHYLVTAGAIKQGAGNINPNSFYTSGEQLNTMRIHMLQAGIQLDKEHEADGEEVSLMTQVISACIARGYTFDKSSELYQALAAIAEHGLKAEMDALSTMLQQNTPEARRNFQELIIDTLVKSLAEDSNPNRLAETIAHQLISAARTGVKLDQREKLAILPYSDPGLYHQMISKLSIGITKTAIKLKVDGVLSMLCPSYQRMMLYGGKMRHEWTEMSLLEEQAKYDANPIITSQDIQNNNWSNLALGKTYKVVMNDGTYNVVKIITPLDYYKLKNTANVSYVIEDITAGRDLAHYNCKFEAIVPEVGNRTFQIWDLASVARLYRAEQEGQPQEVKNQLRAALQEDLSTLHKGSGIVEIIGRGAVTISKVLEVTPYEVILPAYFATSFGLNQFDDLSNINEQFFIEKQQRIASPQIPDENYDLCIKRLNGQHIYIKKRSTSTEGLVEKKIQTTVRQGKVYRKDLKNKGEVLHGLSSKNDKIYVYQSPNGQNYEVIETDNLDFYLDEFDGQLYAANDNTAKYLLNSENKHAKKYFAQYRKLVDSRLFEGDFLAFNRSMRNGGDENSNPWKYEVYKENAKAMYASFQKALRLVAARIPSQSMQSFMPMKIVGFDNSGKNTAYVSTAQIWLQGSDYDIDTATFTRFATDKSGRFIHWSPLADFNSFESLTISDNIPFPTGKNISEITPQEFDGEFVVRNLFTLDENLDVNTAALDQWINLIKFVNTYGTNKVRILNDNELQPRVPSTQELNKIIETIDNHNTFLFKQNKNRQLSAIKNFMLTRMYQVIESPANQIQAQVPIDTATGIVKSESENPDLKDARLAREAIPGDASVKITGIFKNQVGKKGVGICAVGLKSYFASFLYYTSILNESNNPETLARLLIKKGNNYGITINGKTYYGLANSYLEGLATITDEQAKEIAERFKNQPENVSIQELKQLITHSPNPSIDAAIILSALLSQATDNAKEGSLGKLNAGMRTLGMYIYGIVIGMPFHDVADIMMSPAAIAVNQLMDGNTFTRTSGLIDMKSAFDIIDNGPRSIINDILERYRREGDKGAYAGTDRKLAKRLYINHEGKTPPPLYEVLQQLTHPSKENGFTNGDLNSAISIISNIIVNQENTPLYQDLLEASLNYLQVMKSLRVIKLNEEGKPYEKFDGRYYALKSLQLGAEEFRTLGQILHLNQGINTSIDEFQNYIETFEGLVTDSLTYQEYLKFTNQEDSETAKKLFEVIPKKLTIKSFIEYPDIWIKKYEQKKVTFNILDIVNTTPHFKQYLNAVRLLDAQLTNSSAKYRITRALGPKAIKDLRVTKTKDKIALYGRLDKMMDDYIQTEWLLSTDKTFRIQEGQQYFDYGGTLQTAKSDMDIPLGTFQGRASFKLWMEQTVIPNLKKGFDGRSKSRVDLLNNKFIQDLSINSFDNTPNHINVNSYTLPINMSPRTEEETVIFESYKRSFNTLGLTTSAVYTSGGKQTNIQDLFFLYNIVAFQNQIGESTLKRIFEDSSDRGMAKEFYLFESWFDENSPLQQQDIPSSYWRLWATPVGSTFNSKLSQVFAQDKENFGLVLMERRQVLNEEGMTTTEYQKSSYTSDQSHVGFSSEDLSKGIKLDKKYSSTKYSLINREASISNEHGYWYLNIGGQQIKLDLSDPYITKLDNNGNTIKELDMPTIDAVVENTLNPC